MRQRGSPRALRREAGAHLSSRLSQAADQHRGSRAARLALPCPAASRRPQGRASHPGAAPPARRGQRQAGGGGRPFPPAAPSRGALKVTPPPPAGGTGRLRAFLPPGSARRAAPRPRRRGRAERNLPGAARGAAPAPRLTWMNWMVSADLPTPPPPTTTSRYFSCPGPSLQPAAMGEPGGAERGSAARSGASLPAAFPARRPPPARRRAASGPAAHGARRRHSAGNGAPRRAAAPSREEQRRAERKERRPPPQPGRRGYKWPPGGGAASSAMLMSANIVHEGGAASAGGGFLPARDCCGVLGSLGVEIQRSERFILPLSFKAFGFNVHCFKELLEPLRPSGLRIPLQRKVFRAGRYIEGLTQVTPASIALTKTPLCKPVTVKFFVLVITQFDK